MPSAIVTTPATTSTTSPAFASDRLWSLPMWPVSIQTTRPTRDRPPATPATSVPMRAATGPRVTHTPTPAVTTSSGSHRARKYSCVNGFRPLLDTSTTWCRRSKKSTRSAQSRTNRPRTASSAPTTASGRPNDGPRRASGVPCAGRRAPRGPPHPATRRVGAPAARTGLAVAGLQVALRRPVLRCRPGPLGRPDPCGGPLT